ncbi:MAG: oligosaccharide flippase family protein, partial [Oscillospiraceae bacterium]|nr:oligosaccharide flippase family protein [Oscillospiraceae bacterium]
AAGLGLLQLVLTVSGFAMVIGLCGMRTAAMYLCAEEYGKRRPDGALAALRLCSLRGVLISGAVGIALFFLSDTLAEGWIQDLRAAESLRILGVCLPLNCLISIWSGYFTACDRVRELVIVEIVERLLSLAATFLLLIFWAQADTERACCAILLGGIFSSILTAIWMAALIRRKEHGVARTKGFFLKRRLFRLCIPLALNEYLRAGLSTLEQFLIPFGLAHYSGSRDASMASYGTISGMVFPILMFPAAILYALSDLLIPELARCRGAYNQERIQHLVKRCLMATFTFAAVVAAFMFIFSKPLGMAVYQSEEAGKYLRLFAPMILFLYTDAITDGMCKGLGQQVACVRCNTVTSLLDVIFLYLLLPRFGIGGYYFSFVITHLINFALSLHLLLKATGLTFFGKKSTIIKNTKESWNAHDLIP